MNRITKALAIAALALFAALANAQLPDIALEINGHKLTAEVASTDAQRTTGLMERRILPENRGMVFVFPYASPQSFWMMNTYIPLSIAFIDEAGTIVNIEDNSELTAIDPNKLEVKSTWPLAPCEGPSGLSIDRKNRRLFAGCDKMMAIVDADSGKVLATPAIGDGVDATTFDAGTGLAFASCGEGVLTVVKEESPGKFSAENVPTQRGARTLALDAKTHNVFVVTAEFGPRPAATADNPHPRPPMLPDSFVVLVVGR